jgi:hypothetical protein
MREAAFLLMLRGWLLRKRAVRDTPVAERVAEPHSGSVKK